MDSKLYLRVVETDGSKLIEAVQGNLDTDIAFLDDWSVRDLAAHTGAVWSMAAANVAAATTEPTRPGAEAQAPDGDAITDWLGERLSTLLDTLNSADTAAIAWSFTGVETAGWWIRRMAHENAVHRWDAQAATGTPEPIDSDLGADAVDEYAEVSLRHSSRLPNRSYPAGTLHLHRTDGEGEWMFARGASEDEVLVTHEHGKGDAAVRASGSDLALWVRNRPVPADRLEIFGDPDVAAAWQTVSP